jgi:predicted Fe-Mo cluster-binding NifX family protein
MAKKRGGTVAAPDRQKARPVAVCSLEGRVCPRFDLTPEALLFDLDRPEHPVDRIDLSALGPEGKIVLLRHRGVENLIVGGIQERFQELLRRHGIDLFWGIIGTVEEAVAAYGKGELSCGMGRVRPTGLPGDPARAGSFPPGGVTATSLFCNLRRSFFQSPVSAKRSSLPLKKSER